MNTQKWLCFISQIWNFLEDSMTVTSLTEVETTGLRLTSGQEGALYTVKFSKRFAELTFDSSC